MALLIALFSILISDSSWASCPGKHAVSKESSFLVRTNPLAERVPETCMMRDSDLAGALLEVVGCYPYQENPDYLVLKVPDGFTHECFPEPPGDITVFSRSFRAYGDLPIPSPRPEHCESAAQEPSSETLFGDYHDPIHLLISDDIAAQNSLKQVEDLEKYHSCLLDVPGRRKNRDSYLNRHRTLLATTSRSFNVPLALLTCLCGRESLFDPRAGTSSGTKGLCMMTGGALTDVAKWVRDIPEIKSAWARHMEAMVRNGQLEHRSCATAPINKETLTRCPSLEYAAGAVYLVHGYSLIVKNENFYRLENLRWDANGLNTLVTLAGAFNAGVSLSDRELKNVKKDGWQRAMLNGVCSYWGKRSGRAHAQRKFDELLGHFVAIRSCMQADNWLNHQGRPLQSECAMDAAAQKIQADRLAKYKSGLPSRCP